MFRRALDVRSFLSAPAGRYVTGNTWLVFHVRDHVAGLVLWGTPSAADLEPLLEIFRGFDSPLGAPLPRYFDVRRLEAAEQSVIAVLGKFVADHATELRRVFTLIALVHQGGLGRAISEGIRLLAGIPFEWAAFEDTLPALRWLRCDVPERLARHVDELAALAAGDSLFLHEVRAFCAAHLGTATLGAAAHELRSSARTLQRRLAAHGTSFQRELNEVRLARAKDLLLTGRSLTDVAREIGCEPRYFTALFRRRTGQAPSAWRAEQRSARSR